MANKTPGCSREKSFSVRPGLLRGNRGSNPVNERVPVFLPLKTIMMGGMGGKVSMIHGSNVARYLCFTRIFDLTWCDQCDSERTDMT